MVGFTLAGIDASGQVPPDAEAASSSVRSDGGAENDRSPESAYLVSPASELVRLAGELKQIEPKYSNRFRFMRRQRLEPTRHRQPSPLATVFQRKSPEADSPATPIAARPAV